MFKKTLLGTLAACAVAIPPRNRSAFEAAVLGAAEKTNLSSKGNRETFLEKTLPNLVKKYQA